MTGLICGAVLVCSAIAAVAAMLLADVLVPGAGDELRAYIPLLIVSVVPFTLVRLQAVELAYYARNRDLLVLYTVVASCAIAIPSVLLPVQGVGGLEIGWLASQIVGALCVVLLRERASEVIEKNV